jgi:hypothetical protein
MYRLLLLAALMLSCDTPLEPADTLDLSRRLGPGQVLAGAITQESALFGGGSAEGQVGDFKIYNDRVRFIIQGARSGGYYVEYGGGIIDADVVRAWGQPGMDMLDEHAVMAGLGRLMKAESIEVINDGTDGKAAVLRVHGVAAPMQLLSGAVENHGMIPHRDVAITTDYILQPDSWLLELQTTLDWQDETTSIATVDMVFMGFEVAHSYFPGTGLGSGPIAFDWAAGVGENNEMALAVMQSEGGFVANAMLQSISNMAPVVMGTNEAVTLSDGDSYSWSRFIGIAPDLATLTDAWYEARNTEVQTIGGSVTASGQLVAGARVHVLDDAGSPITMAITGADGTWTANVPEGVSTQVEATGRGLGVFYDLAPGAGWYGPYAADSIRAAALQAMSRGARPIPFAHGYGTSQRVAGSTNTPLSLTQPATLQIEIADGGPAVVRVDFADVDLDPGDRTIVHGRPSGAMAWLYIKDGSGSIAVEPGNYTVIVHRGMRHTYHSEDVQLLSGETTTVQAALHADAARPGIYAADPHAHGGPSGDGGLPMEARLVSHAAHGIDIHFGTDHDHIADYRPLLAPLSLDGVLASVVATEVSPVLRGHFNAYPIEEERGVPNNGALLWYQTWDEWLTTAGLFDTIRDLPSDGDVLIQANHPVGPGGLFGAARYDPESGTVGSATAWSPDFDAMEVLNSSPSSEVLEHYMDLVCRGLNPTPVGVSDSHSHRGGVGQALTYVPLPIDNVGQLDNDHIRDAWRAGGTVPSTGPQIEARVGGRWAPGQTFDGPTTLKLKIWAPDWMPIDGVNIYQNMALVETIEADGDAPLHLSTTIELDPEADAVYFFEVVSSLDMSPVYPGAYAWALTAGIKIDADGGGWTPPLPSIVGG